MENLMEKPNEPIGIYQKKNPSISGPNYMSSAVLRMLRRFDTDTVGMSRTFKSCGSC